MVITSRFPYPLEKGDKLRAYYQIRELSEFFQIHLIALTEKKVNEKDIEKLSAFCSEIHIFKLNFLTKWSGALAQLMGTKPIQVGYFYNWKIHRKIKKILKNTAPDHIYCQLIRASEYVKNYHDCPKTLDYMDALSKGIERRSDGAKGIQKRIFELEHRRLLQYENAVFEYFENHTIISEQDRKYIFHKNKDKIVIVPNGVDTSFFEPLHTTISAELVFTGNMSYPPNVTACKYIVEEILPLLPEQISIILAGANPSREVLKLGSERVKVTGFVEDIRESYLAARIFIAPMFIGTGLQNKLLEAMALGIPCITTTLANNALRAEPDKEILIANDARSFSLTILRLLNDQELYDQIAGNGKTYVRTNFHWKAVTGKLIDLMDV